MTFQDLNLLQNIQHALSDEGYTTPTPIQQQAIPVIYIHLHPPSKF